MIRWLVIGCRNRKCLRRQSEGENEEGTRQRRPEAEAITNRRLKCHVGKLRDEVNLNGSLAGYIKVEAQIRVGVTRDGYPATSHLDNTAL